MLTNFSDEATLFKSVRSISKSNAQKNATTDFSKEAPLFNSVSSTVRENVRKTATNLVTGIHVLTDSFNRPSFVDTVRTGDILISGRGVGILIGHAAIMINCNWVLEMPGGEGWQHGIEDNNRCINKYDWYKLHKSDLIKVYRNKDPNVAEAAARWAERTYYNPYGGSEKTKHITYKLTNDVWSTDPSYCSKLVIQAYHLGTGNRKVIRDFKTIDQFISPNAIPTYFLEPYTLVRKGIF